MCNLGFLYIENGRLEEAHGILSEVHARADEVFGPDSKVGLKVKFDLARILRKQGLLNEADASLVPLAGSVRRILGQNHPHLAFVLAELAMLRLDQDRPDDALTIQLEAVAIFQAALGAGNRLTQAEIRRLVDLYDKLDCSDEAAAWRSKLILPEALSNSERIHAEAVE